MCSSDLNNLIETPTIFFMCGCPLQAGSASFGCVRVDTIINQIYLQELTKTLKRIVIWIMKQKTFT